MQAEGGLRPRKGGGRMRAVRALLRTDRADDELAQALARAGLYVERVAPGEAGLEARLRDPDLAVVDPRLVHGDCLQSSREGRGLEVAERSLEELCAEKFSSLLDRLGGETFPDLYDTVVAQVERALFRVALERAGSVGAAAELLGIHRNTLARKLAKLGLRSAPARRRA